MQSVDQTDNWGQSQTIDPKLVEQMQKVPYLMEYVTGFVQKGNPSPTFHEKIDNSFKSRRMPNLIYPISENNFIHINAYASGGDGYFEYVVIGPPEPDARLLAAVDRMFAMYAGSWKPPDQLQERFMVVGNFLDKICVKSPTPVQYDKIDVKKVKTITVYEKEYEYLKYHFVTKRVGLGILDPFLTDPHLEDISIVGAGNVYIVHKIFGSLKCTVWLTTDDIDDMVIGMAEQFGKTISHARPLVDATLPEGSRINIVFGKDVSRRGTNATIRRFASVPMSITQIINSKSLDAREAAYMWMMVGEGMSCFINGETASGKTTTMMGITQFIPPTWKIVSIEDTPEITLPHKNWISEVTRDTGSPSSSVVMFDLLKAALRQRPNYILVGEIRGAEANIAFQAMQTGHPVMSTFHAAQMSSLIQRLTGEPMKIPKPNVENLNIALFQAAVQGKDGKPVRRVLSINEIVGYNGAADSVMFVPVFTWEPASDTVTYRGKGSSNLFLTKILLKRGLSRKDESSLYDELELRTKILEIMIKKKIFNYYDVYDRVVQSKEIGLEKFKKELDAL
ncbi:MAG: type II/IV secretion system ATPase subunit [Thermoproteota archaeon]